MLVLIKGAGDLGSGVAVKLHHSGFQVMMSELPQPTTVRCQVAFSRAVYQGKCKVEDVTAVFAERAEEAQEILAAGRIPVILYDNAVVLSAVRPDAVVDAIVAKHNTGTALAEAGCVVALGPGFIAGRDCHAVIETMRGHDLGRVLYAGAAAPNSGAPGMIDGLTEERILRAPCDGIILPHSMIGAFVERGEVVAAVAGKPLIARTTGVVRGLLPPGTPVHSGMKGGDVDPRGIPAYCYTISDKARCVAGGVLEAILHVTRA